MLHKRRGVTLAIGILVLTTALVLPTSGTATAVDVPDQVLAWNQHAYDELIVTAAQAPPVAVLHLAMVHGAIYDAVNAIDGGYEPYLGAPTATGAESKDAAAAAAAYQVLSSVLPADRDDELLGYYTASLEAIPDGDAEDDGVVIGNAAATAMIVARTDDGRFGIAVLHRGHGARRLAQPGRTAEPSGQQLQVGGRRHAVPGPGCVRVRDPWPVAPGKRCVRCRVPTGEVPGKCHEHDQDRGSDGDGAILGRSRSGDVDPDLPSGLGQPGALRHGERALFRDALSHGLRCADRLLPGQGTAFVLAADDRDPTRGHRRERGHGGAIPTGPP